MSTQYRLVQSGKTASGGCSAGQGSSEPVAPRIYLFYLQMNTSLSLRKNTLKKCFRMKKY
jgi:carbohydrate-binding DOMON domain-containing protein